MGEVFVVDSQATVNLVPPKQQSKGTYVLYTLLGLALLGVFLHGVFIYHLYQRISTQQIPQDMIQSDKQIGENKTRDDAHSKEISPPAQNLKTDSETKSAAFLHHNHYLKSDTAVMQWAARGFPAFTHNFNYSNGCLIIPKDGFYYLFSKVAFRNSCKGFTHEIKLNSSRYSHQPVSLMTDRYSCLDQIRPHEKTNQISSYLGGVFKLYKKDKLFVSVSDLNNLVEGQQENFFGGFMI